MDANLPPLPAPECPTARLGLTSCELAYTADQMRAYALAERERCAKLAESFVWFEHEGCEPDGGNMAIARLIRGA